MRDLHLRLTLAWSVTQMDTHLFWPLVYHTVVSVQLYQLQPEQTGIDTQQTSSESIQNCFYTDLCNK
jgi:hypothetical protein